MWPFTKRKPLEKSKSDSHVELTPPATSKSRAASTSCSPQVSAVASPKKVALRSALAVVLQTMNLAEAMMMPTEILSLALNHGQKAENTLYRLRRGTILRLVPGASLLGRHVALYCNYPLTDSADFIRTQFTTLNWFTKDVQKLTDGANPFVEVKDLDIYCEIEVHRSGTFYFYIQYDDSAPDKHEGALYVQVEPIIYVGPPAGLKVLPLDSIRCQTVMAKCLGPINTWEKKLRVGKESGYNLIHFTPIQELGGSRSGYSLQDQLSVNHEFGNPIIPNEAVSSGKRAIVTFNDVDKVIKKMREEWGMASICDIVLNHTANESLWLQDFPEATYSCFTSPHLRPAYLLDALYASIGQDVKSGKLETVGVPEVIECEDHLQALKYQIHSVYLPKVKIHELYQCNIDKYVNLFTEEIRNRPPPKTQHAHDVHKQLKLIQDPEYKRLGSTICLELALDLFNVFRPDCYDEDTRIRKCLESFRLCLEHLNRSVQSEIQSHLNCGVENCLSGIRYERVQGDGPQIKTIEIKYPLFQTYFTNGGMQGKSLKEIEAAMYGQQGKFFMAHNGWVMNGDPLTDFARPQTGTANVYLRRELIAWGDSVKLRYGDKPEDSPYLWSHMRKYVETTAKIFDGVRLDNCHSTPLHVAEYLLDCARKVNKELFVVAELFTNSDSTDNIFVNRLGITSLIREALSAWDSHEEGRLVHRYGGAPVGAFSSSPRRPLAPAIAHALFLDLTHDNPSPVQKRSVFDLLPSAGLVSMACCATGSTRGYDELVPHHIHVVDEEREYQEWQVNVNADSGIIAAKRALNLLHGELAEQGFNQVYVDQMDLNIVAVTRHNPNSHQSVILVAHTSFGYPDPNAGPTGIQPLKFEGNLDEIILEASLTQKCGKPFESPYGYKKDEKFINGLTEYKLTINEHIPLCQSTIFKQVASKDGNLTLLEFQNLRPGSVVAVRVSLHEHNRPHLIKLDELVAAFHFKAGKRFEEIKNIVSKLDLLALNRAMYRCDQEERDMGKSGGCYDIPGYGPTVYGGTQGFVSILNEIAPNNDLGHPICNNLRQGNWMIEYVYQRLASTPATVELSKWYEAAFSPLKEIPRYLIPSYFDVILTGVHNLLREQAHNLMPDFVKNGSNFIQGLALGSLQCIAVSDSANLPTLSPATKPPAPEERMSTLSAGLPHFSTGYMRCWGRDTFIAIRGLMYLTGRFNEARYIILGFANTLRHGLIPNLLDNGVNSRFNCRDAVWWWLYAIKQYVEEAPNGTDILTEKVSRIYPTDDSEAKKPGECDQPLCDVIQEALSIHFQGLVYRERNAGRAIDEHMVDKGFNNQIGVHPDTGFVFGGNEANCGTWMDKMGSCTRSGNKGKPSTPRDGSAIELVGLQVAALRFLSKMNQDGVIPHGSVERTGKNGEKTLWSYNVWADHICENFEKFFYVGHEGGPLVNKKGIYKDTYGATQAWADYQLRCNFPIAMVAAPEMFNPKHAWEALEQAKKYLLGPLGMKTLDPEDWSYRGNYNNSIDSEDASVSHGANYHQGPEWVWPIGFFLRARLIFAEPNNRLKETVAETWSILTAHLQELKTSHWRGLPELTNENGAYCRDSCRTQAWSMATVLEVLYDLNKL